jgi:hypothetical protein
MVDRLPPVPAPPEPKKKTISRTWAILGMVLSLFIGIGIGAAAGSSVKTQTEASPLAPATTAPPAVASTEAPTEAPNLDGTWQLTGCDLQLFVGGGDLSLLVAAVQVKNTGNVPAKVTVSVKWDALPGPLFDGGTKVVTLNPGGTRELRFTKRGLTTGDVDRVQSSPGYQSASNEKLCKVHTSIDNA